MDNVTHALAGLITAELLLTARRDPSARLRSRAYWVAVLANNLPDIDAVYTRIDEKPLGSLLQHRGHTHTLLLALPAAALLAWAFVGYERRRGTPFNGGETRALFGLAGVGVVLHLLLDFGNNYGVHPFWPVSATWFYGDSIFIVEPLWWALTIPLLAPSLRPRWLQITGWALLALVVGLCFALPIVNFGSALGVLVLGTAAFWLASSLSPRRRALTAAGAWLAVAGVFAHASHAAEAAVIRAAARDFPGFSLREVARTPAPANPFCFSALVIGRSSDQYRVLSARVSTWPEWVTARACPSAEVEPTAPVAELAKREQAAVHWEWEYRAPLFELRALALQDCRFRALLHFARAPYFKPSAPTARPCAGKDCRPDFAVAGDLRYDRARGLDFADVPLGGERPCPRFVPGWQPPRRDLLLDRDQAR